MPCICRDIRMLILIKYADLMHCFRKFNNVENIYSKICIYKTAPQHFNIYCIYILNTSVNACTILYKKL